MIPFEQTKWASIEYRQRVIAAIKTPYNIARKKESFDCWRIYNDKIDSYVKDYLISQLSEETANSMPIISSINIGKKIVKSEATIYNNAPKRVFTSDNPEVYEEIYKDSCFDDTMRRANEYYKLMRQTLVQVYLDEGKLKTRVIQNHNYDVIVSDENHERASGYVLSSFDRQLIGELPHMTEIRINESSYRMNERYIVWDNDVNFTMNGNGEIISQEVSNPLEMMPFVDVSSEKDMEYFVSAGDTLCNFTVQYNAALSDLQNIIRLQGYAQAIYKAPNELQPQFIKVGPTNVIRLVTDPDNKSEVEFDFKTPSPNIEGSIKSLEQLLANYLSTRGADTNAISGSLGSTKTYASGVERMLAMIDKFEASRGDLDLFKNVEYKMFNIIKKYAYVFSLTPYLDNKYTITVTSVNDSLSLTYNKPESIKTDQEKLDYLLMKEEQGLTDKIEILMELDGMTKEQAIEKLKSIKENNDEIKAISGVNELMAKDNSLLESINYGDNQEYQDISN